MRTTKKTKRYSGGAFLAIAVAAALFLPTGGSSAAPTEGIVIHGAASGSHLKLTVDGSQLFVEGPMAHVEPTGCHFIEGNRLATCSLKRAESVTVSMGPSDDKVTVIDPLPVPLVAYLGSGSDKLIGNAEPDICYPEGTRRNRCIGGPGDDVCISAPVNTDCVGGAGDDYCKVSIGSDGCWGGPGDDVCYMGPGNDGCHGEGGNDRLYGGPAADQLYGGPGFDYCDGPAGVDRLHDCDASGKESKLPRGRKGLLDGWGLPSP